jgi:hypothetical protein
MSAERRRPGLGRVLARPPVMRSYVRHIRRMCGLDPTPADGYEGRQATILDRQARIKRETLAGRKRENLTAA